MSAPEKIDVVPASTPDDALAQEIVEALIEAKLMQDAKKAATRKKIASGEMDQDDWRALVEFKRDAKEGEEDE